METDRGGTTSGPLPSLRLGVVAGLVGILCCVGPTVLALYGLTTWLGTFA